MSRSATSAIVGVGTTAHGELPGFSADQIAVMAVIEALADAGIDKSQIDGLITCKPPVGLPGEGTDESMSQLLGISPAFSSTLDYGACGFSLQLAAMAIEAGLATTILLTFGTNGRTGRYDFGVPVGGSADWNGPQGLVHVAGPASMALRRHMSLYGTTEEQFGWIAVSQREWAVKNPRAIFREPLTIDDYLNSPYQAAPLRRADLTMISDGGVAIVLTRADRAANHPHPPVYISGMSQASGMRGDLDSDRLMRPWIGDLARKLYASTGVQPADVQLAYLQDATSVWVLQQLEYFGFCELGEGGPFVAEGNIRPGGRLPVNTGGGQLSESYMWNWLNLYEAVMQLRDACGPRQAVDDPKFAVHSQTHDFWKGAATMLSTLESI